MNSVTVASMIELRPQPLGIYPPPATNLLLPAIDDANAALPALLEGNLEVPLPAQWEFFAAAAKGQVELALQLLSHETSPLAHYNRFVLAPTAELYQVAARNIAVYSDACRRRTATTTDGPVVAFPAQGAWANELAVLLDVAAYAAGLAPTIESEFPLDGELLALALAASAAFDLEQGRSADAAEKIKRAVEAARGSSPVLAATLLAQHADIMATMPGAPWTPVVAAVREANRLASNCKLPMLRAELSMKLGMVLQNAANGQRGPLLEAANAYQAALQFGVTAATQPEMFAQLQNNLGLVYLSMPAIEASQQLRTGIAVQSFRRALEVYSREEHPDMWASINMNLASALVYAPSSHPQDNLIQAVEIYEDVLTIRCRAKDPVAYALVLLNQANALAHLGIFKPALDKLAEAYKLFHWYEQIEQAEAAQELLEQINQARSATFVDN